MPIRGLVVVLSAILLPMPVASAAAQSAAVRPLIAVLDLEPTGAAREQALALSNQLRVELLRTGQFTVVDRSQINAILEEQAFQQTGCTSQECAIKVGRILGVRQLVVGTVTRPESDLWQVSVMLVDVETAETVRAETLNFKGAYRDLLFQGMDRLAQQIAQVTPSRDPIARTGAAPEQPGPSASWRVKWIGALALGVAAAYYGFSEAQATTQSNDKQKTILDDMGAATTSAQYLSLQKKLKLEEDAAKTHKTNSNLGYTAAAVLIGLTAWVYFDPPPPEDKTAAMSPFMIPGPDALRVGVALRW